MTRKSFTDSFDGHAADRLLPFVGWIPLIGLGLTPIMIATMMTNPMIAGMRECGDLPAASRWMTLKWRCVLMAIALLTLGVYNYLYWDYVNIFDFSLIDRFNYALNYASDFDARVKLFGFYFILPAASVFFLIKSILEVLCSRSVIASNSFLYRFKSGVFGVVQLASFIFFFMAMCLVASGVHDGVLAYEDFIILTDFYFISSIAWVFRKNNFDFKRDFGEEKNVRRFNADAHRVEDVSVNNEAR